MKAKTRILSFVLALALIIGCLPLALFAAEESAEQLGGAVLTEEDIEGGSLSSLTDLIPSAKGIMSAQEISELGVQLVGDDASNLAKIDTNGCFTTVEGGSDGDYIQVGAPSNTDYTCGSQYEFFLQLGSKYTNNTSYIQARINDGTIESYKGKAIVISTDIRLNAGYNLGTRTLMDVRTYFAFKDTSASYVSFPLITVGNDGTLKANGETLSAKVNKNESDDDPKPFTTVAIHIIPEEDRYDVYVDGVCVSSELDLKLSEKASNLSYLTFEDMTYASATDKVSSSGIEDFVYSYTRFMHIYCTYHGDNCPDSCTNSATNAAPCNITADQFAVDNMKAYYSDFYLECSEHDIVASTHTHDVESLTSSALFSCNNCGAKWNATVPMDQTGNALCDLCEIDNAANAIPPFHSSEQIKSYITTSLGSVQLYDGTDSFYVKTADGTAIENAVENGNTFYKLQSISGEIYKNVDAGDMNNGNVEKYVASQYKGKSFVIQIDLRLGSAYTQETVTSAIELVKTMSYCANSEADSDLESITLAKFANIAKDGTLYVRDGSASDKYIDIAELSADEFTTVALHVKLADSENENGCGSFDVYVNGELKGNDIQYLTSAQKAALDVDTTINGTAVKIDGIEDYCLTRARFFHIQSAISGAEDILHADNIMVYFADEYEGGFTQHSMVESEHKHDYSEGFTEYGSYCELCGVENKACAVLDANGDRICDLCMIEKVGIKGNGVISVADLKEKLEELGGSVIKASSITSTSPYGFSGVSDSAGRVSFVESEDTENYLSFNAIPTGTSSGETHLNVYANTGNYLSNYESDKGKSFVYSLDVKLGDDYAISTELFKLLCYLKPAAYDEDGDPTKFTSLQTILLKINSDGCLTYRNVLNGETSYEKVDTGKLGSLKASEFTTISIHVRPQEGELGLYSIYANGELVAQDIQLLTQSESDSISWTVKAGTVMANNTTALEDIVSEGVKDYSIGIIRSFQMGYSTASDVDGLLCVKNPKLYYSDTFAECKTHSYSLIGHEHDTDNDGIIASLRCHCGVTATIELPIDTLGNGKCDTCDAYILSGGAVVTGRHIALGELISLKFHTVLSEALLSNDGAVIVIKAGERTKEYKLTEAVPDENGEYVFEIKLSSVEMAVNVNIALELDGILGNSYTTSVRDYAEVLMSTTESAYEKELCRAMLNYGAASQAYFAVKSSDEQISADPANSILSESEKEISDVNAADLVQYALSTVGQISTLTLNGATLVLDSKISMKLFYTASKDIDLTVCGTPYTPSLVNGEYVIVISDLLPQNINDTQSIVMTSGDENFTIQISVLSAVYALLSSDDAQESFKDLGRAIYLYSLASEMYLAESAQLAEVVVKDGAKGAVALVLDDGTVTAANYVQEYLYEYEDTAASFALITKNFATLTKDSDGYVMSEDGKYTYTQTEEQQTTTEYWQNYLSSLDKNGEELMSRIELISHSHTHANPSDGDYYAELLGARHIIQGLFGYDTEALITPGGFEKSDEYNAVKQEIYIAARGTNASEDVTVMLNMLSEFDKNKRKRLDAFMVQYNKMWLTTDDEGNSVFSDATISAKEAIEGNLGEGNVDISHVEDFIDAAMENSALAAFCIHGIVASDYNGGVNESGLHIYEEQAEAIFAYVQKYAETGELWSATYSEAVKYFCQWNTAQIDARRIDDRCYSISLEDDEDDSIFDMALTLKISVDDSWTGATVTQGSTTEDLTVMGEAGARYVLVNIVPDSGIALLKAA